MRRIGNIFCYAILFLLIGGSQALIHAQNTLSVEATVSETTLYSGERLQLDITISGDFSNVNRPELPSFSGFNLLNSTPSTSRSISYVNGVTKSSYTYSYYLSPQGEGNYKIPSVSIEVDGKKYQTDPINIKVVNRQDAAKSGSSNSQPDIFLRLKVSNARPVAGEQLIASVVLLFKEGLEVRSYQPIPGWKAEGFWKEELASIDNPEVESTIINGVRYRSARLLQFSLFPTKSGKLTISPYQVRVAVRSASRRDDPFSSFFGGFGSNQREVELESDPVSISVAPLPEPDSINYIGAVGSFQISRSISTSQAKAGESIEIETTISGTGNVPLINKPEYDFPEGLQVYEPQENSNIKRSNQSISGSKTYTDVVVARTPGNLTIPETTVAYYDPGRNAYVSETLPAKTITIERNPDAASATNQTQSFSLQPITGLASWISPQPEPLSSYWWFWAGILLPALAFGFAYWQKTYRDKMSSDRDFARSQKAAQKAQDRLDEALAYAKEDRTADAYNALQKGLTGFIGDRLGLPEAGLSIEQYITALQEENVNNDLIKNVRMLLNKCATINYAPESSQDYLKSHVGLAESIIQKLKKEL